MAASREVRERARERSQEVCSLLATGLSIAGVAGVLGVTRQRVHQLLKLTRPEGVRGVRPKIIVRQGGRRRREAA